MPKKNLQNFGKDGCRPTSEAEEDVEAESLPARPSDKPRRV